MIMLFYSLAFVCFIANIVYTFKIIINSIKKRETENFQVKMFWGTLIAVWGLAGLGFVIDNDVRLGFTSFAMIPISCFFPCLIRLVYIYVKKESGLKKKWWALTIICFATILPIYSIGENLEPDDVKQARIEKEAQVRKAEKERKAAEEQAAIEKNKQEQEKEISQKLQDMNEEEIALYKNKYQEYSSIMGDAEAKLKAVKDVEENTKKKKQELQDLYDKQKQYEEWIAWQKSEEEKQQVEREHKVAAEELSNSTLMARSLDYINNNSSYGLNSLTNILLPDEVHGGKLDINEIQNWEYMNVEREANILRPDTYKYTNKDTDYLYKPLMMNIVKLDGTPLNGMGLLCKRLYWLNRKQVIMPMGIMNFDNGLAYWGIVYITPASNSPQQAMDSTYVCYIGGLRGDDAKGGGVICKLASNGSFIIKDDNRGGIIAGEDFHSNLEKD